jgi:hypothetical protein
MGYLFFQGLGTLSEHLVTEEGDLWCSEDSLCWGDEDPVSLKSVEEIPYLLLVLLERPGEDDVVQAGKTECRMSSMNR